VMGRTHAASGWCVGLLVAPLLGVHAVAQVVSFAALTAGYALLPDLDHPHARATRLLGPLTGFLSYLAQEGSRALYARTKGPRDEDWEGTHRHMTHTLVFAVLAGGLAALLGWLVGPPAVWVFAAFGLLLALDALGSWLLVPLLIAGAVGLVTWWAGGGNPWGQVGNLEVLVGLAVFAGCLTHDLGDALTLAGCPILFPLQIAGETWYELGTPGWMRFKTGGTVEKLLVFPMFTVAGVLLVPGALHGIDRVFTWMGGVA
jgi:Predicted membrane-bound metal-dependent hydrolase (DUF457).